MNKFYKLPKALQWIIAICMTCLFLGLMSIWIYLNSLNSFWFLSLFLIAPLLQFLLTPIFTLLGLYKYLSPMLLVYGASDKKYDIHNGTSFDYLFVMKNVKSGLRWRSKMLGYYIEGLLVIIDKIERGELPETIEIRGSSYFFNERTAERMGFEIQKTGISEKVNIILNIIDLTWMYSKASGVFTIPNALKVKTATITGGKLVGRKTQLEDLFEYLNKKSPEANLMQIEDLSPAS